MFTLISWLELSPRHFKQYPVWAEYSEPDDINEIVSWGLERRAVVHQLEQTGFSDQHVFPVLKTDPLPCFRFLFLKAEFRAADGARLTGYVIGQRPYCVGVFAAAECFLFNENLPEMAGEQIDRLRRAARLPLTPFFPLRYSTAFRRDDGTRVEGEFG
jgi:hypothetical protein